MRAIVDQPLRLVLANESSIQLREGEDKATPNVIVVHLPWTAPEAQATTGHGVAEDDLANATWEDAEWQ